MDWVEGIFWNLPIKKGKKKNTTQNKQTKMVLSIKTKSSIIGVKWNYFIKKGGIESRILLINFLQFIKRIN